MVRFKKCFRCGSVRSVSCFQSIGLGYYPVCAGCPGKPKQTKEERKQKDNERSKKRYLALKQKEPGICRRLWKEWEDKNPDFAFVNRPSQLDWLDRLNTRVDSFEGVDFMVLLKEALSQEKIRLVFCLEDNDGDFVVTAAELDLTLDDFEGKIQEVRKKLSE